VKSPWRKLNRSLRGLQSWSGCFGGEKKSLALTGNLNQIFLFSITKHMHCTYSALLAALFNCTEYYVYTRGQYTPEYLNKRSSLYKSIKRRNLDEWELFGL
jgi:hypothetical protein